MRCGSSQLPTNYAAGDFVIQGGKLYFAKGAVPAGAFNAGQWSQVAALTDIPALYVLPIASTSVLGGVKVDGTSITASGSGVLTVPSTAVQAMNDNRVINGDMRIDQRNNGASGTATGYTVDRWQYGANVASKGIWGRGGPAPTIGSLGFPYFLQFTSSSAYAAAPTDTFTFNQRIEADMVSDFAWGTANAQPVDAVVLGKLQPDRRVQRVDQKRRFYSVLPVRFFPSIREHLDEDHYRCSRRHGRGMGDER